MPSFHDGCFLQYLTVWSTTYRYVNLFKPQRWKLESRDNSVFKGHRCQLVILGHPGVHCKSKTGRYNQDWSRCATNNRRTLTRPVLINNVGLTYIINFWHSGSLALSPESQSARMSEIKNVVLDLDGTEHFKM